MRTADRNSHVAIEEPLHSFKDRTSDILEIEVDAIAGRRQCGSL
jgi:hypothetical protein